MDLGDPSPRTGTLMLRFRADWRSLLVVAVAVAIPLVQWFDLYRNPILWVAGVGFAYLTLLVNHNHQHVATFRNPLANRIFEWVMTLTGGLPCTLMVPLHNRNHHRAHNGPDDFMRTALVSRWPAPLRLLVYPFAAAIAYAPRKNELLGYLRRQEPRIWWRLQSERALLLVALVGFFVVNPRDTFCYLMLPWGLAQYWGMNANFIQHEGCDADNPLGHTRDYTGKFLNWITFNGGYHLEHHNRPGLHWSKLPAAHQDMRARFNPNLMEPHFLRAVLRIAWGRTTQTDAPA
jgi:fatty acid desaturase